MLIDFNPIEYKFSIKITKYKQKSKQTICQNVFCCNLNFEFITKVKT
jgi:hypothetical protein